MLPIEIYIILSVQLFVIGVLGVLSTQNNLLFMLMSIELILLSANLIFIVSSLEFNELTGQICSLFILTVAAAESAIGLSLLILLYKLRGTIAYPFINLIKG
jgi:NADH-quinone oxidoreductase subunit K